jgi:hypothetical protein
VKKVNESTILVNAASNTPPRERRNRKCCSAGLGFAAAAASCAIRNKQWAGKKKEEEVGLHFRRRYYSLVKMRKERVRNIYTPISRALLVNLIIDCRATNLLAGNFFISYYKQKKVYFLAYLDNFFSVMMKTSGYHNTFSTFVLIVATVGTLLVVVDQQQWVC